MCEAFSQAALVLGNGKFLWVSKLGEASVLIRVSHRGAAVVGGMVATRHGSPGLVHARGVGDGIHWQAAGRMVFAGADTRYPRLLREELVRLSRAPGMLAHRRSRIGPVLVSVWAPFVFLERLPCPRAGFPVLEEDG